MRAYAASPGACVVQTAAEVQALLQGQGTPTLQDLDDFDDAA